MSVPDDKLAFNLRRISIYAILLFIVGLLLFLSLNKYRSAFEADQACHSQKIDGYGENPGYGCDHDLETRQWLLYEKFPTNQPAKVLRRYRY